MNQTHPMATNFVPVAQQQASGMYMVPAQQQQQEPKNKIIPVRGIKGLSISMTVLALLIACFGMVAVVIETRLSYVGVPVWTGLGIFLATAILGLLVYSKKKRLCMNIALLIMTGITAIWGFASFIFIINSATVERRSCNPRTYLTDYYYNDVCLYPQYARIIVDVVLALLTFAYIVIDIVLFSLTMYATLRCCRKCDCCKKNRTTQTREYMPYSSVMMVPVSQGPVLQQNTNSPQPTMAQPILVSGSPSQAAVAQPLVIAGSGPQSALNQPVMISSSPHQSSHAQQVIIAGSPPQTTIIPQSYMVVAGSSPQTATSPHQLPVGQQGAVGGPMPQPSVLAMPQSMTFQPGGFAPQMPGGQVVIAVPQPQLSQPSAATEQVPQSTVNQPNIVAGSTPANVNIGREQFSTSQPDYDKNSTQTPAATQSQVAFGQEPDQQQWQKF